MRADEGAAPPRPPEERLKRETDAERSAKLVAGYEQSLREEPEDPDTQGKMLALANLYRQKMMDYEAAAYW